MTLIIQNGPIVTGQLNTYRLSAGSEDLESYLS